MRWLFCIAALGALSASAPGAEVQLFGVNVPSSGDWAVYARISDPTVAGAPAGRTTVAGISSIGLTISNTTSGARTASLTAGSVSNMLPTGSTSTTDPNLGAIGYGFWLERTLNPRQDIVYASDNSSVTVGDAQYTEFDSALVSTYKQYVLQGVGLASGSKASGGNFTSATYWTQPVIIAKGKYTPPATSGSNSVLGLGIATSGNPGVGLLLDMDSSAAVDWSPDANGNNVISPTATNVVDARTYTGATIPVGSMTGVTVSTIRGDANLDGKVDFADLVKVSQNYKSKGTWFTGDFNFDGTVDFADLVIVSQNYKQTAPVAPAGLQASGSFASDLQLAFASVPEPSSAALVLMSGILLLGKRRMRQGWRVRI